MPETRISVVIPARDDARHLDRCLRALATQTHPPWEVVVVDNASTDDTAAVARAHGARVVAEPRVGIPAAAATGYDAASGEVIARLDADSVPPPDWVARVGAAMSCASPPDAVTGTGVFYDAPRGLGRPLAAAYLGAYYLLGMAGTGHHVLWGSNMAVSRQAWQGARGRVHRHDPEVHDDMDLALVLGPRARIRLVATLRVGVSARSLVGGPQLRRRFRRAFRTLELNWADAPPWERWAVRLSGHHLGPPPDRPGRRVIGRTRALSPALSPRPDAAATSPGDPVVVLVPGLALDERDWSGVRPLLGRPSVVVRLPALGTRPPRSADLRVEALAGQLLQALNRVAPEHRAVLVGHSASCPVVVEAARRDRRVAGLVLVGPITDSRSRGWPHVLGRWTRTAVHERVWEVPVLLPQYTRMGLLRSVLGGMDQMRWFRTEVALADVEVPVTVVRGEHDRIAPADWAAALTRGPVRRVVTLAGGAHMVPLTHPAEVADAIVATTGDAAARNHRL